MWKFVFYISGHRRNINISLIWGVNHILHTVNKHNSMNSNEDLQKGKLLRRKMHAYQRDKNEEFSTNERGMRNCCMSKKIHFWRNCTTTKQNAMKVIKQVAQQPKCLQRRTIMCYEKSRIWAYKVGTFLSHKKPKLKKLFEILNPWFEATFSMKLSETKVLFF